MEMYSTQTSNLDLQRKNCRVVVGIEGVKDGKVTRFLPKDFDFLKSLSSLSSDGFRYYAIIHDKDNEYKHIHLVLLCYKTIRLKQFCNAVADAFNCDTSNVSIRECSNITKNIQYLIHKNESKDKHRYLPEEVFSNDDPKNVLDILQADTDLYDELISSESLDDIVKLSRNPMEIYYKLGYKFVDSHSRVIRFLIRNHHPDWLENGLI